jgi:hypothetical protein
LAIAGEQALLMEGLDTAFSPPDRSFALLAVSLTLCASVCVALGLWPRAGAALTWIGLHAVRWSCAEVYDFDDLMLLFVPIFALGPSQHHLPWHKRALPPARPSALLAWCLVGVLLWVYGVNAIVKGLDPMWTSGSATWIAFMVPLYSKLPSLDLRGWDWAFVASNHLSLLYEAAFGLVFVKPLRRYVVGFGVLFHLSLMVLTPLPTMSLGLAALVSVLLPWGPLGEREAPSPRRLFAQRAWLAWLCAAHLLCAGVWTSERALGLARPARSPVLSAALVLSSRGFGIRPYELWLFELFNLRDPIVRMELIRRGEPLRHLRSHDEQGHAEYSGRQWKYFSFFQRFQGVLVTPTLVRYARASLDPQTELPAYVALYTRDTWVEPTRIDWEALDKLRAAPWRHTAWLVFQDPHAPPEVLLVDQPPDP